MTQGHESHGAEEPRPAGPVGAGVEDSGQSGADQVEEDFEALLADAQKEKDEYLELARRTQADFENFRKRMAAEVTAASARGKAALVGELVHVIDNLERALAATEVESASSGPAPEEALIQGIRLTYRDLSMALENHGVEIFDPTGEKFDPAWHEALTTKPAEDREAGTVIETLQKGYRLDDKLIRPARVVVSE